MALSGDHYRQLGCFVVAAPLRDCSSIICWLIDVKTTVHLEFHVYVYVYVYVYLYIYIHVASGGLSGCQATVQPQRGVR